MKLLDGKWEPFRFIETMKTTIQQHEINILCLQKHIEDCKKEIQRATLHIYEVNKCSE